MKKIHNANSWEDEFFASCMCFLTFSKKWKNAFLLLTFLKQVLWTWKYVQKKLVIGPDLHQKFHQNRVISQKYTILQKGFIFYSTSRYLNKYTDIDLFTVPIKCVKSAIKVAMFNELTIFWRNCNDCTCLHAIYQSFF